MRFFASADETGNVKEVVCAVGTDTSRKDGQAPELVENMLRKDDATSVKHRISHMDTFQDKWLVALRHGGLVGVYALAAAADDAKHPLLHTYTLPVEAADRPVALLICAEHEYFVAAFASGTVAVVSVAGGFGAAPVVLTLPPRQTKTPATVDAFVASPYAAGVFAWGGKDNDLQVARLYDARTAVAAADFARADTWAVKVLFRAHNVGRDHLHLKVPIWITQILFQQHAGPGHKLVTATRHGHIRQYATAADKEPVESFQVLDKPITRLAFATADQSEILVCDTHTFVARYSLVQIDRKAHRVVSASAGTFYRPSLKLLGKYAEGGNTGAVHGLDVCPAAGVVVFGGLDRYLRVFDVQSRRLLSKVYLGVQISAVKAVEFVDAADEPEVDEAEENEEFWSGLERKPQAPPAPQAPLIKRRKRVI